MIFKYLITHKKLVLLSLIGIILILGLANIYYIKKIDKSYSELLISNNHNSGLVTQSIINTNNALVMLIRLVNSNEKGDLEKTFAGIDSISLLSDKSTK